MKRIIASAALPLALLLLAGCSLFRSPAPVAESSANAALRAQCERASDNDPAVHTAIAKGAGNASFSQADSMVEIADARRAAVQKCMLAHGGIGHGGGVELPRR